MSTTITSENDVEIRVSQLGFGMVHPEGVSSIWARLTPEQRVALAEALNPASAPCTPGGQWTRDDFARLDIHLLTPAGDVLDAVVAHLNAHHPKPEHPMSPEVERLRRERDTAFRDADHYRQLRNEQFARAEKAEKRHTWPKTTPTGHTYTAPDTYAALCHQHGNAAQAAIESWDADECPPEPTWEMVGIAHREVERIQRERDEWKARAEHAEQLIPAYAMLDIWMALGRDSIHFDDWYDEHGYAEAWAELTAAVREARTAPAVSRADVEKAIRSKPILYRWLDDSEHVEVSKAVDAVCDLFGIEAEQAVDPVDEQTDSLADILYGDELVTDQMRGVLERVVRAGMLFPEQEASRDE